MKKLILGVIIGLCLTRIPIADLFNVAEASDHREDARIANGSDDFGEVMLGAATSEDCIADLNDDGVVDINDLLAVLTNWGACLNCHPGCGPNQICDQNNCICKEGFADCDGDPSNGCEIDLMSDSNNCGACNEQCEASETCNGGTCVSDCFLLNWYIDLDGDGFGNCDDFIISCDPVGLYMTLVCGDCDDTNPYIHPAAIEICNGIDENCDGVIDNSPIDCLDCVQGVCHDG